MEILAEKVACPPFAFFYRVALGGGKSFITVRPAGASIVLGMVFMVTATVPISP
jgi:hypothetical protein